MSVMSTGRRPGAVVRPLSPEGASALPRRPAPAGDTPATWRRRGRPRLRLVHPLPAAPAMTRPRCGAAPGRAARSASGQVPAVTPARPASPAPGIPRSGASSPCIAGPRIPSRPSLRRGRACPAPGTRAPHRRAPQPARPSARRGRRRPGRVPAARVVTPGWPSGPGDSPGDPDAAPAGARPARAARPGRRCGSPGAAGSWSGRWPRWPWPRCSPRCC